jgi:glycosyltransferase involved in cell wall biosynthesis
MAAAWRQRVPMVFEVRDLWPELPIAVGILRNPFLKLAARILEKTAYLSASAIVALSPGMAEGVARTGYPERRIHVIPNCCDIEFFKTAYRDSAGFRDNHEWLKGRPLVVYCGTLGEINGVDYLVRVAHAMLAMNDQVRFLVVGRGKMEPYVRAEAERLKVLDRNFFMMPSLAKQEVAAVFAAADISASTFVDLPEMWSNSANKFFDSLASGTPVMINYRGWKADILEETGAGFVVEVKSPVAAAGKICERLGDAVWLKSAGVAAKKLAEERFCRDVMAKKLEAILVEVVRERADRLNHGD